MVPPGSRRRFVIGCPALQAVPTRSALRNDCPQRYRYRQYAPYASLSTAALTRSSVAVKATRTYFSPASP